MTSASSRRFQEFPFVAYVPDEPWLEVDGVDWPAGPVMYAQAQTSKARPPDRDARRPARTSSSRWRSPSRRTAASSRASTAIPSAVGPTPFPTGYGPTLTGPGVYISAADAERLQDGAHVRLRCAGSFDPVTERNVLAELPGEGDEIVVVCAHYDSAWRAAGAVDNASGVEGVRRVVERLAGRRHRRTLVAAAFGAEELGLSGARFFVHEAKLRGELGRIKAVVNLECLARGERLELWAAPDALKAQGSADRVRARPRRPPDTTAHPGERSLPFRRSRASRRRASCGGRSPSTTCRPIGRTSPTRPCSSRRRCSPRDSSKSCSPSYGQAIRCFRRTRTTRRHRPGEYEL